MNQASLLGHLEPLVGSEGLAPEPAAFTVDGLTPQAAVSPSDYEQVAEVVRYAHAEGLAVIPWGGGTHMHVGNVPARYDIALSLSRLNRIVEHEPADLTASCQAGITLDRLRGELGRHRQLVPLEPWGEKTTVGGALAANAAGPSRHAYGAPRDFTIGLRVVTADGRITRTGGRVVKNVAGYDLVKLYIGSLGTLGIIVEATFKLAPQPRAERTVLAAFDTATHALPTGRQACAFAAELQRRGLALRAVQLLNPTAASTARLAPDGSSTLVLDLAGTPQAVERSLREISELAQGTAAELRDATNGSEVWEGLGRLSPDTVALSCRAMALPTQLPSLIDSLEATDGPPRILALPTIGVLYASWPHLDDPEQTIRRLRTATSGIGGSLIIEACPPSLKRSLDVFGEPPPSFDLMRRVKQQFDPRGVLSPGRQVGRL